MSLWADLTRWCRRCLGVRKDVKERLTPAGNPLPSVIHQVLQPEDLGPGRLIIVGDVHGCYDTLLELLRKLKYTPRHDNLILVGDLVDKGPKSQQVVAAARAWCEGSKCWVVRGNHDDAALGAGLLLQQGGELNDLEPKFNWVSELLPEDVDFLSELPFSLTIPGYNVLVVHAALVPGIPLEQQDLAVLTKARDLAPTPDGGWVAFEEPQENSQAWANCWQGPFHVFFGHDARRNLQEAPCATGLDTGCVYGRQLTACVLPPLSALTTERDVVVQTGRNGRAKADHHERGRDEQLAQVGEAGQSGLGGQVGADAVPLTPLLQQLGGNLHSIPSGFMYDKKAAKAAKAACKAAKEKKEKNGKKEKKKREKEQAHAD